MDQIAWSNQQIDARGVIVYIFSEIGNESPWNSRVIFSVSFSNIIEFSYNIFSIREKLGKRTGRFCFCPRIAHMCVAPVTSGKIFPGTRTQWGILVRIVGLELPSTRFLSDVEARYDQSSLILIYEVSTKMHISQSPKKKLVIPEDLDSLEVDAVKAKYK